jgi:uncharacterized protein (TIGR02996 family)
MTPLAELDGAALLRAVIDDPADDVPRLAYADWLEENGQDERAAYIRGALAGICGTAWTRWPDSLHRLVGGPGRLEERGWSWVWRRGFIAAVHCPLAEWIAHGPALAAAHPLEEVRLSDRRPPRLAFRQQVVFWRWYVPPGGAAPGEDELPEDLFDAVHEGRAGRLPFDSEADALAALSRGCIAWARAGNPGAAKRNTAGNPGAGNPGSAG